MTIMGNNARFLSGPSLGRCGRTRIRFSFLTGHDFSRSLSMCAAPVGKHARVVAAALLSLMAGASFSSA